ncbi:MAG: hypothetical protein RR263_03865, partial [Oscillospiraceae bacterium]
MRLRLGAQFMMALRAIIAAAKPPHAALRRKLCPEAVNNCNFGENMCVEMKSYKKLLLPTVNDEIIKDENNAEIDIGEKS